MKKIFLFIALAAFTISAQTPTETFNLTTLQPLQGTNWNFDADVWYDSRPSRFPPDGRVNLPTLFVNNGANLRITGTSAHPGIRIQVEGTAHITLENAVNRRTGPAVVIDYQGRYDHPSGTIFPEGAPFFGLPSYYHRASPMQLVGDGTHLTLTLVGENELVLPPANAGWSAGLGVPEGTSIVIQGDGKLTATGGTSASGIGGHQGGIPLSIQGGIALGHRGRTAGNITINSGTIIAEGRGLASGIGSGSNVRGGTITINGGDITAIGGTESSFGGAGIGGGGTIRLWTNPLFININGGTVRAIGGPGSPGIGSGQRSTANVSTENITININDGEIYATGGGGVGPADAGGAGIGGARTETGGNINIRGGTIIAVGGRPTSSGGAGIGGGGGFAGTGGHAGVINISGGTIHVRGGGGAQDIGNGSNHSGAEGVIRRSPNATIDNVIPAQ